MEENMKQEETVQFENQTAPKKKGKKGKIIAIIIAIVLVLGGTTVGIMAAQGVFTPDKVKAFDLLAQAPEALSRSSINEYVGTEALTKAMQEKGGSYYFKISEFELGEAVSEMTEAMGIDLSDFFVEVGSQADILNTTQKAKMGIGTGSTSVHIESYVSKDKVMISLPGLVDDKVVSMPIAQQASTESQFSQEDAKALGEAFETFLADEVDKLHEEIECTKYEGDKEGYTLVIKKATLDILLNDFVAFVGKQEKLVNLINQTVNTTATLQGTQAEKFDLVLSLQEAVNEMTTNTTDFTFHVFGKDGKLERLETTINADEESKVVVSADFAVQENDTKITLKVTDAAENVISLIYNDKKGDGYVESSFVGDVTTDGASIGTLTMTDKVNTENNEYTTDMTVAIAGGTTVVIAGKGSLMNLKQGSSVEYVIDDLTLSVNDMEIASMKLDTKMAVLDGTIAEPAGTVIDGNDATAMTEYSAELQTGLMTLLSDLGLDSLLTGASGMDSYGSDYDLEQYDYDIEDYDLEDYE